MKRYDVVINGIETTLQLTDADAAARGLTAQSDPAPTPVKARTPANKARKAPTKAAAD